MDHRSEFRVLTSLLSFVTTLTSGTHTLGYLPYFGALEKTHRNDPNRSIPLNAVTSVAVRDSEVVAVLSQDLPRKLSAGESLPGGPPPGESPPGGSVPGGLPPDNDVLTQSDPFKVFACQEAAEEHWLSEEPTATVLQSFTAMANSERPNHSHDPPSTSLSHGQSWWDRLQDDAWAFLSTSKLDPLPNHIATITDYVNAIRKQVQDTTRQKYIDVCSRYVISSCWRKMRRRISLPTSARFIALLKEVDTNVLRKAVVGIQQASQPSRRRDRSFAEALTDLPDNALQEIMDYFEPGTPIPHKLRQATNESPASSLPLYNAETSVEFHRLLVGTIVGYHDKLNRLNEAFKNEDAKREDRQGKAIEVLHFAHVLWLLSYSSLLRHHLATMETAQILRVPHLDAPKTSLSTTTGSMDGELDGEVNFEDDVEIRGILLGESRTMSLRVQRWIRLQVSHFAALDILTSFGRNPSLLNHDVEILLLRVTSHPHTTTKWQDVVRHAISSTSTSLDADAVINMLQRAIDKRSDKRSTWNFKHGVYPCSIHCEAALVSLAKYEDAADIPCDVKEALKGLNHSIVAVSKLCCPVCWELLRLIRGNTSDFAARGFHPLIFPVDLPPWLPNDVMENMVQIFRNQLCEALKFLVDEESVKMNMHSRHSSLQSVQSDSGFTTDSSDSSTSSDRRFGMKVWAQV